MLPLCSSEASPSRESWPSRVPLPPTQPPNHPPAPPTHPYHAQEKVACLSDNDAHLALDPKDPFSVQTKPHGHGDVHMLLHSSGLAGAHAWTLAWPLPWLLPWTLACPARGAPPLGTSCLPAPRRLGSAGEGDAAERTRRTHSRDPPPHTPQPRVSLLARREVAVAGLQVGLLFPGHQRPRLPSIARRPG
jgi:hypothetical protein